MIGSESNEFRESVVFTKVRLSLVTVFEYGQFSGSAHVCGAGPLGDRSLPRRSSGYIYGGIPRIPPHRCTSEVGRFLRKRHLCGAGSLTHRSLPRKSLGSFCWPLSTPSNGITKSASGGFPRGRAWINF